MRNDVSLIATLIFLWGRPVRGVFFVRCILFMQSLVYLLFAAEFVLLSTVNVVLIFMQGRMPSLQAGARSELFRGS